MQLSPHFSLAELTRSQTALRLGIPNEPDERIVANLTRLCALILEPARALLGVPLQISSGYRSPRLNGAVGGAPSSAHLEGRAADVLTPGLDLVAAFDTLRHSALPYDQIIQECGPTGWVHIAVARDGESPRREMLTATGHAGAWKYERVAA